MFGTPFVNQGSSGSAVIMGKTAKSMVAPKKLIAPAKRLPEYFIFFAVVLWSFYLNLSIRPMIRDIKPP